MGINGNEAMRTKEVYSNIKAPGLPAGLHYLILQVFCRPLLASVTVLLAMLLRLRWCASRARVATKAVHCICKA